MIKTLGYKGIVARAGMCVAVAMGIAANGYSDNAQVSAEKYEMNVLQDATGGKDIVIGNLQGAIETLRGTLTRDSKYAKSTNLCVALTLTKNYSDAEQHCQSARSYGGHSTGLGITRKDKVVLALNNLGVFYALSGNTQDAQEYFKVADSKGGRYSEISRRNIRALEQRFEADTVVALES